MLNEVLNICEKWCLYCSTDVKVDIKEQEIKDLVAYLTKKYLQNLKYR